MKKLLLIMLAMVALQLNAQNVEYYSKMVKDLSSKKYMGRGYAYDGANKAGRYLEKEFTKAGVDEVIAGVLPEGKEAVIRELKEQGKVAMVGDGINDAPVLAMSSVGFAMGGIGSDAAIEAADIVIMNDSVASVLKALNCAVKTRRIVMENIYGALFVKFVILLLGALGMAGMWAAVFADVGVAVLAILNAIRAMK